MLESRIISQVSCSTCSCSGTINRGHALALVGLVSHNVMYVCPFVISYRLKGSLTSKWMQNALFEQAGSTAEMFCRTGSTHGAPHGVWELPEVNEKPTCRHSDKKKDTFLGC